MRLLRQLMSKLRPGAPEYIELSEVTQKWITPTKSMKEAAWRQLPSIKWFFIGWFVYHTMQYYNDIHMVNMVRSDVKLYPEKPKITYFK